MLGEAMSRCLKKDNGLKVVYLPEGVDNDIAVGMLNALNAGCTDVPHAVLISESDIPQAMSPNDALKYRQGDRTAIALGRHTDIGSFTQSFREIIGLNYPEDEGEISLEDLSLRCSQIILEDSSLLPLTAGFEEAWLADVLHSCFRKLVNLHKTTGSGSIGWNTVWFSHVAAGLDNLRGFAPEDLDSIPKENLIWSSFGLPHPTARRKIDAAKIADAFLEYWGTSESARHSSMQLSNLGSETEMHPLASPAVPWERYDELLVTGENTALAFAQFVGKSKAVLQGLAVLPDSKFVKPEGAAGNGKFELFTIDDCPLNVLPVSASKRIDALKFYPADDDFGLVSEEFRIVIPTSRQVTDAELVNDSLAVGLSPKSFSWEGGAHAAESAVVLEGRIRSKSKNDNYKVAPRKIRIEVICTPTSPIVDAVSRESKGELFTLCPTIEGIWIFRANGDAIMGPPDYLGPEVADVLNEHEGNEYALTLESHCENLHIIAWTGTGNVKVGSTSATMLVGRPDLYAGTIDAVDQVSVGAGDSVFSVGVQAAKAAMRSPLLASLFETVVSPTPLSEDEQLSVRGAYESWVTGLVATEPIGDQLRTLGHWVLPEDRTANLNRLTIDTESHVHCPTEFGPVWETHRGIKSLPADFLESREFENFGRAFEALNLDAYLNSDPSPDGQNTARIPSMTSWRALLQTEETAKKLDDYLLAYAELMKKARTYKKNWYVRFWAAYPFSISVWDKEPLSCTAVLISPLHPIRLAWLASVENVLAESSMSGREQLVGTVEGWNFPYVGPSNSLKTQLVAIPAESGVDQLFLGWSMMLPAAMGNPLPLHAPSSAGSLTMPGSAASGINAASVRSALRDFWKVNSHLSTLTVDLASTSRTARIESIDATIIQTAGEWAADEKTPLSGGLRVLDSVNRLGSLSANHVSVLKKSFGNLPAVWKRYSHDSSNMPRCNLRVLQDGGVAMECDSEPRDEFEQQLGLLGRIPLRRFQLSVLDDFADQKSASMPGIHNGNDSNNWKSFMGALQEVESTGPSTYPVLRTSLYSGLIANTSADWTVAGESFMDPISMSNLVFGGPGQSQKMLWEWRPPFLQNNSTETGLERRPFVAVAKIPHHFKERLQKVLSIAHPDGDCATTVDRMLNTLGSRGVGLSSMLAIGGTHASGAIGFYLVFELMSRYQRGNEFTFVMPIDACDTFLHALGDHRAAEDITKRADLLIISIEPENVTLLPVEIKAYGLGGDKAGGALPHFGQSSLTEALDQLGSTVAVLREVEETYENLPDIGRGAGDRDLWYNALACLVESALRLSPSTEEAIPRLHGSLENILRGESRVTIGASLVTYFKHGALSADGRGYRKETVDVEDAQGTAQAEFPVGLLAANPQSVFESIYSTDPTVANPILDAWTELVDWAKQTPSCISEFETSALNSSDDVGSKTVSLETSDPFGDSASSLDSGSDDLKPTPRQTSGEQVDRGLDPDPSSPSTISGAAHLGDEGVVPEPTTISGDEPHSDSSLNYSDGVRFTVGHRSSGELPVDFWPSNTNLNQLNVGVVGDLGTGKTQLIKSLVYQLRQSRPPLQETPPTMLIFDYKQDFQSSEFLQNISGEVLNLEHIPLNFFDLGDVGYSAISANNKAKDFVDVLSKIYSNIGPVQSHLLKTVIKDLFKEGGGVAPSIYEVLDRYEQENKIDSITSILSSFVDSEIFEPNKSLIQSFDSLIEGKVIVVPLNQLGTDDQGKNALVTLFLNMYYDYMLRLKKWSFTDGSPSLRRLNSFLVVDEAVNIMGYNFPVLMRLLLQGREFGVGVMLASQYLSHFKQGQTKYMEPLLTWFIHKVPQVTAKELAAIGIPADAAASLVERISTQKLHESLYKSLGWPHTWIRDLPYYKLAAGS